MAGLSVASSPVPFANTFANNTSTAPGAVRGVAQTSTNGINLQGNGGFNNATIAPAVSPVSTPPRSLGYVLGSTITGSIPSKAIVGPAPAFRQVYNGITFTDPTSLAQYQAAHSFQPVSFNGQTYTDPTQYANAVLGQAQQTHDQAVKQINTAHDNGLISFDQQQQLIDQSRQSLAQQLQSTLDNQSGYFNSISPDAVQSQQGAMANQSQNQYNQGVGQINNNQTNLANSEGDFATNYTNSLQSADQALQTTKDQLANNTTAQSAANQSTLDAGQNAAIAFQNSLANYNTQAANATQPTVTQFDPVQIAQGISTAFTNAKSIGLSPTQATPAIVAALQGQGIDTTSPQFQNILNYALGQTNVTTNGTAPAYVP